MSLVSHDPRYRRTWMFQRNIRRISPWKIKLILLSIQRAIGGCAWNQASQDRLCKSFEEEKIKRSGTQYDARSGGPRTYLAQLKNLGLVFQRKGSDKRIYFTRAGEDILEGVPPLQIIQAQLLNHQYPSFYSANRNVLIHPHIKIKPFVFVLMLLHDSRIEALNDNELIVPIVFGHGYKCFDLCVEKILSIRSGTAVEAILRNPAEDLYTPRSRERNLEEGLRDIKDIANTCRNWLVASQLVETFDDGRGERIRISQKHLLVVETAISQKENFVHEPEREEAFQRRYGCWDRKKDTRALSDNDSSSVTMGREIIAAKFYEYCREKMITEIPLDLVDNLMRDDGLEKRLIIETLKPLIAYGLEYFEAEFVDMSTGGNETAIEFEKAVCSLFADRFQFQVKHTGQLKRQGKGAYADSFVVALDAKHCAIIDAKARPHYSLNATDYYTMKANYIPNYLELTEGRSLDLEFCLYVAGGFAKGINNDLYRLKNETGIPVSAVDALDLLSISKKFQSDKQQPALRRLFSNARLVTAGDFQSGHEIDNKKDGGYARAADSGE